MILETTKNGALCSLAGVPFTKDRFGFFTERGGQKTDVPLMSGGNTFYGALDDLDFSLTYLSRKDHAELSLCIRNRGNDFDGNVGFHVGVDTCMETYPKWNGKYFPTMLRCEKTHLWGYYMSPEGRTLAIATSAPIASYDLLYNRANDRPDADVGHRILGTDLFFYRDAPAPDRHPQDRRTMRAGEQFQCTVFLVPAETENEIGKRLSSIAGIPVISAEKYTMEMGETPSVTVYGGRITRLVCPDGTVLRETSRPLAQYGLYRLYAEAPSGKTSEACLFVRRDFRHYLHCAAENARAKPPRATTNAESFYGLFSAFLTYKHEKDATLGAWAYAAFDEVMPYMFDVERCVPLVIPHRIQNVSCLISLMTDIYEADPVRGEPYLRRAARFAEVLMRAQDETGAYRNRRTHYTCVVYIAKSMLELAEAERACGIPALTALADVHYESARRAVDELTRNLDNIGTEGQMTFEDGMISCSALQIAAFALTLPREKRAPYTKAAEYMIRRHACLEQNVVPDCRCHGATLRYWEAQYDVMIRAGMMTSPHGWSAWTGYAKYALYLLTGKREYLQSLMDLLGSCVQLVDENGNLRWAFCSQPYVSGPALVPDTARPVAPGYRFDTAPQTAYRGIYENREFTEQYVNMISDWYRTGDQKVTGGYEFCPLILDGRTDRDADRQGGCCDNDVHEIFKCIEETVLGKAFLHENEDGTFLCYGCTVRADGGELTVTLPEDTSALVCRLQAPRGIRTEAANRKAVTVPDIIRI